jgi:hypothetical protein
MQRDVEAVAFAGKVFAQLMFGFDQDRTVFIFHHLAQAHAQGVVVLPQDGRQVIPLGHQLEQTGREAISLYAYSIGISFVALRG